MLVLFTVTSFLSAFLLFLIQPVFAKMLLPVLGGAPAVWNTAMVFYQGVLLAGYAYGHLLFKRLRPSGQFWVHGALLIIPLAFLPFALPKGIAPPATENPIPWVLATMATTIGVPFFMVTTGAPILQKWFHQTRHAHAEDPYFLYTASNAGSLLALIAYPFMIEPRLALAEQSRAWTYGYVVLVVLLLACGWFARRGAEAEQAGPTEVAEPIPWPRRLRWIMLAFVPSSLMLGVTSTISSDIASMPLLWLIPLTLYILSFVLVFARKPLIPHRFWQLLAPLALASLTVLLASATVRPKVVVMSTYVVVFFLVAMAFHGELVRDRPHASRLTDFYLTMSFGGVLGGIFCGLVAPSAFNNNLELHVTLLIAAALLPSLTGKKAGWAYALPVVAIGLYWLVVARFSGAMDETVKWLFLMLLVAVVLAWASLRPIGFVLGMAGVFVAGNLNRPELKTYEFERRSFFGVLRVIRQESTGLRVLRHGTTVHGYQPLKRNGPPVPASYYHRTGPVGQVLAHIQKDRPVRMAVLGLGAGTMACYCRKQDSMDIYEIDPLVLTVAEDPKYFTYLSSAAGDVKIIVGDGRIQLNRTEATYDAMVFDAYSSDAVPIHLITREAVQLYLRRLAPNGVLLFHISNRHLDMKPVLAQIAAAEGLVARVEMDNAVTPWQMAEGKTASEWVVMTKEPSVLATVTAGEPWKEMPEKPGFRGWTDDYSSLIGVWKGFN